MKPISLLATFLLLGPSILLSACAPGQLFGPTFTPTPTVTSTPTYTRTRTSTQTNTRTPRPTSTQTIRPTLIGTPLRNYGGIPIPADAISGEGDTSSYSFTSRQSPIRISAYYQQVLPQYGCVIEEVYVLGGNENDPDNLAIPFSAANHQWQGIIFISRSARDGLTWVDIVTFTTD